MKRLGKTVAKAMWRKTEFFRKPLLRKFEAYLARCLRPTERLLADETNTLMEHVVRELVRVQRQLDYLQQTVEELASERGDLAIAGEIEPDKQLKAG
jgi:hypothetical protein